MIEFERWRQRHPQAAAELTAILTAQVQPTVDPSAVGKSEAWAQQQDRFKIARAGALAFRNNNGATPAKCEKCGRRTTPVRYGLANDSAKLNEQLKSSDLILGIPRLIRPQDVGRTLLQFGSDEVKKPGWFGPTNSHERAQEAWLALIASRGGYATFSTGDIEL